MSLQSLHHSIPTYHYYHFFFAQFFILCPTIAYHIFVYNLLCSSYCLFNPYISHHSFASLLNQFIFCIFVSALSHISILSSSNCTIRLLFLQSPHLSHLLFHSLVDQCVFKSPRSSSTSPVYYFHRFRTIAFCLSIAISTMTSYNVFSLSFTTLLNHPLCVLFVRQFRARCHSRHSHAHVGTVQFLVIYGRSPLYYEHVLNYNKGSIFLR